MKNKIAILCPTIIIWLQFFPIATIPINSTRNPSIVNGVFPPYEPSAGQFPFHASLMQYMDNAYRSFCGGSLIHSMWVLTAAHCIQLDSKTAAIRPNQMFVGLGSIYRSAKGAQIHGVQRLVIHGNYLKSGGRSDIGLVKLKTGATMGRNVQTISLHKNPRESLLEKTAYLTGFGIVNDRYQTPTRLRRATLHVSNYKKCQGDERYKNMEICAASTIAEGKACKGDSGGPLFVVQSGKRVQIGITSHLALLPICGVSYNHSVYTRVSAFIAWISQVTGIKFN